MHMSMPGLCNVRIKRRILYLLDSSLSTELSSLPISTLLLTTDLLLLLFSSLIFSEVRDLWFSVFLLQGQAAF